MCVCVPDCLHAFLRSRLNSSCLQGVSFYSLVLFGSPKRVFVVAVVCERGPRGSEATLSCPEGDSILSRAELPTSSCLPVGPIVASITELICERAKTFLWKAKTLCSQNYDYYLSRWLLLPRLTSSKMQLRRGGIKVVLRLHIHQSV